MVWLSKALVNAHHLLQLYMEDTLSITSLMALIFVCLDLWSCHC
jgi:hypothetical protein